MWIANCVFQGSGNNGRAIDTNTLNGGTPALYIKGAPTLSTAWKRSVQHLYNTDASRPAWPRVSLALGVLQQVDYQSVTSTHAPHSGERVVQTPHSQASPGI